MRFLADENLNNDILRALLRRRHDLDIVRVQDVGLSGAPDEAVLEWAADERRLVVTHDVTTMTRYSTERLRAGRAMPGLVQVRRSVPVARAADDLLLLADASRDGEWEGQILFLPL